MPVSKIKFSKIKSKRTKKRLIHHFLPHPELKTRATLLSHVFLLIYVGIVASSFVFFKYVPKVAPGVLGYASKIDIDTLLKDTNKKRTEAGLQTLKLDQKLSDAAKKKASHMFKENYWAHVSPAGVEPWFFILEEEYDYMYAGENLAKNFNASDEVVDAWYKSPSHRENLLNPKYVDVGFAIVNGTLQGYETTLVVQMFGKLRGATQIAGVPNTPDVAADTSILINEQPAETYVTPVITEESFEQTPEIKPMIDIGRFTSYLAYSMTIFMLSLLLLDVWYSSKKGIKKVTGHTLAHILFLTVIMISIWFSLLPGHVL